MHSIMNPSDALTRLLEEKVEFLLLQFTDILGSIKTVEIPANKFGGALAGEVTFDGSALEGFHRTIESELLLQPDLETRASGSGADRRGARRGACGGRGSRTSLRVESTRPPAGADIVS